MKTIVLNNIESANTIKQKIIGLLNTANPKPIYFQTRWGIHTFGMKYPIDVVILDDHNTVKALRINLKPWRIFNWNPRYNRVLELPVGMIYIKGIKIGYKISFSL